MMKHSSRQFDDYFSGFGRQSEKFSRIGACISRNFTPCISMHILRTVLYTFPKVLTKRISVTIESFFSW